MKYLLTKDMIVENWLNPVLSGEVSGGHIISPSVVSAPFDSDCELSIEPPTWLNNPGAIHKQGDRLSIGATFINGQPISSWGARFGSSAAFYRNSIAKNFYVLNQFLEQEFPNGIGRVNRDKDVEKIVVTNLVILKMSVNGSGIGMDMYVKFMMNDNDVWGKFNNVLSDSTPTFTTSDLKEYKPDTKIKIIGKVWNALRNWLQPKTGVYKCLTEEIAVFDEVGQLCLIHEGDTIDVYYTDKAEIKFTLNDKKLIIKMPTYFWFNYFFEKI